MFPGFMPPASWKKSFPRIRGDVPAIRFRDAFLGLFSPHTRGCSPILSELGHSRCVFPAYAGMFLLVSGHWFLYRCFPRIRGDVPNDNEARKGVKEFSPHTRGCSDAKSAVSNFLQVFPAYAGMFPATSAAWSNASCFPRIRGDVPTRYGSTQCLRWFSPHTRGCSGSHYWASVIDDVFPAYAGMFPVTGYVDVSAEGFPRIRGDVPCRDTYPVRPGGFSPHTRGCSVGFFHGFVKDVVFPAYAGMFR